MKKFGLDDTLLSFAICAVLAILGCLGIVAWQDTKSELGAVVVSIATAVSAPGTGR